MNSMTGFGKAEITSKHGKFSVEIASVNNRFLEISPRLPRNFLVLESKIREVISARLERGKINIYINYEAPVNAQSTHYINEEAAKLLVNQLRRLQKETKVSGEIVISDVLMHPEIIKFDTGTIDENVLWPFLAKALEKALTEMMKMRTKEGAALAVDMSKRLAVLDKEIKEIEKLTIHSVEKYRDRLQKRIEDVLTTPINSERLEEEIAMVAERTDITEECIRFHSHLTQCRETLKAKDAVGKRLNFLLQELNREANTIASKCSDIQISANTIVLKEQIEKLREQIQNVE